MAFNCLTQGGVASEQDNVSAAVVAVARVAFQNPEVTLERCCRMALCHRGGHTLLANILCQLPGLKGGARDGGRGLLLCCLEKAVGSRESEKRGRTLSRSVSVCVCKCVCACMCVRACLTLCGGRRRNLKVRSETES